MKSIYDKVIRYALDRDYRFMVNAARGAYYQMNDEDYIKRLFKAKMGYMLDLNYPKTFNEKLQWLKINDRNPMYTQLVDKYEVKKYVSKLIGSNYIIPSYGIWDKVEEITFESLPKQFVLKCTHDSQSTIICKNSDAININKIKEKLNKCLKRNYYYRYREWVYKDIKPRILAEKYIENLGNDVDDYKIHCFNGEPRIILICKDRFSANGMTEDFYDLDWNRLNVSRPGHNNSINEISRPDKLNEMLRLARVLSKDIPFIRTDFYLSNDKIYFGELTFYPSAGLQKFIPSDFDRLLGDLLKLNI